MTPRAFPLSIALVLLAASLRGETQVEVGAARIDITPTHPVILAGYGSRTEEHEGVDTPLFARALAIGRESPVLLLAVENCGVPEELVHVVAERLRATTGIDADRLVVASTHTHNSPDLPFYAPLIWAGRTTPEQEMHQLQYAAFLVGRLVEVSRRALDARRPSHLEWGLGEASIGGNRRVLVDGTWRGFGFQPDGPVDRSLPLLVARDASNEITALWTSHACHCTTPGPLNRISGDWAGVASSELESRHEGAIALTTIGCGADVGPQPTGSLELARRHGQEIAREVERLLTTELTPLPGAPTLRTRQLDLPLAPPPDRTHFEGLASRQGFHGEHARRMLGILDREGALPRTVDFPVTVWTFGEELAVVFLAGEVVVDYSVRLKRELDWSRLWINAWVDGVPGYIPSKRILEEGGYEADFSQIYYEKPSRYAPEVEDLLVGAIRELVGEAFSPDPARGPSPYHVHPSRDPATWGRPPALDPATKKRLSTRLGSEIREALGQNPTSSLKRALSSPRPGFDELVENEGEVSSWYIYTGEQRLRPVLRQLHKGASLSWTTPAIQPGSDKRITLLFIGGLGYHSEPATEGFELAIDGEKALDFDITRSSHTWRSGEVELHYLVTWSSDQDSAGFFLLDLPASKIRPGQPLRLEVRSRGEGSRRWFAVDPVEGPVERFKELGGWRGEGR